MPGQRIAGTVYLQTPIGNVEIGGSWTVSIAKVNREAVVGAGGGGGYKETPVACYCEGDVLLTPELALLGLEAITDGAFTVELANGRAYTFQHAWTGKAPEANAIDGTGTLRFECLPKHAAEIAAAS